MWGSSGHGTLCICMYCKLMKLALSWNGVLVRCTMRLSKKLKFLPLPPRYVIFFLLWDLGENQCIPTHWAGWILQGAGNREVSVLISKVVITRRLRPTAGCLVRKIQARCSYGLTPKGKESIGSLQLPEDSLPMSAPANNFTSQWYSQTSTMKKAQRWQGTSWPSLNAIK